MQTTFTLAFHDSTPPTPWSYWVVEGQLLAGAFPGSPDPTDHRQKIKTLVDAGVRTIINYWLLVAAAWPRHAGKRAPDFGTASPAGYGARAQSIPRDRSTAAFCA